MVRPSQSASSFRFHSLHEQLALRRLSGKKSARGADLGTSQSLLRVEHYGLRDRQMAVIESCSEVED
jgi:hypothetical protein